MKIYDFFKEFKESKNKAYFFQANIKVFIFITITIGATLAFIGFCKENRCENIKSFIDTITGTIAIFLIEWDDSPNILISIAKVLALATISLSAFAYYLYRQRNKLAVKKTQKEPYTLLIGLGEQNSHLLNSLKKDQNILIIEKDPKNKNIEEFQKRGFGVIQKEAQEAIKDLDLSLLENAVISTGNDRQNISIATEILNLIQDKSPRRIFLRVENKDLYELFNQKIIDSKNQTELIPYSIYDIITKDLFFHHPLLKSSPDIIKTKESYNIILMGDFELVSRIIYHLAIISNLPNENELTIHLIDQNAQKLLKKIKKLYTRIDAISHLKIVPTNSNYQESEFYRQKVWHTKNLTNIYIAYNDEEKNLDIALKLQEITYFEESVKNTLKTEILFAVYNNLGLSDKINQNRDTFKNFFTFANLKQASSYENIIDEKLDTIAKLIHLSYTDETFITKEQLNQKWLNSDMTPHKRESNRAQAYHIDTKLLALGLKKVPSNKNIQTLLAHNKTLFEKIFTKDEIEDKSFPQKFDTLLKKLARSEHNRWNTFHFLHGWKYDEKRDDKLKKHNCLIPLEKFKDEDMKKTYKWDIESILNLPYYLAHAGFEIVEFER